MTNTNESKWRRCTTTFAKRDNPFESEIVEVVETGALDELRTQLAAAKDDIQYWKNSYKNMTEHYSGQTEKLRVAVNNRDVFAEAMGIALKEGVFFDKPSTKKKIEQCLAKLEDGNE